MQSNGGFKVLLKALPISSSYVYTKVYHIPEILHITDLHSRLPEYYHLIVIQDQHQLGKQALQ